MDFVERKKALMFYGVPDELGSTVTYHRMRGFTEASPSSGAVEYNRQYIDESTETTDVIGYSRSVAYAFDRIKGDKVHDDIIKIADNEATWENAVREIIILDMSTEQSGKVDGRIRKYAVVTDGHGQGTEVLQYSGTFKSKGEEKKEKFESKDNFLTITKVVGG